MNGTRTKRFFHFSSIRLLVLYTITHFLLYRILHARSIGSVHVLNGEKEGGDINTVVTGIISIVILSIIRR